MTTRIKGPQSDQGQLCFDGSTLFLSGIADTSGIPPTPGLPGPKSRVYNSDSFIAAFAMGSLCPRPALGDSSMRQIALDLTAPDTILIDVLRKLVKPAAATAFSTFGAGGRSPAHTFFHCFKLMEAGIKTRNALLIPAKGRRRRMTTQIFFTVIVLLSGGRSAIAQWYSEFDAPRYAESIRLAHTLFRRLSTPLFDSRHYR